jgi:hypothetical protein
MAEIAAESWNTRDFGHLDERTTHCYAAMSSTVTSLDRMLVM